ncbi:hypothetical protein BDFB_004170 [Asbolus verrucosus]|uniref:Uncharacterized protein n=1 Tax=Asbolus verrucosus TaxID=1661398 RepID=A0A482VIM7_ASBVE|nr:hypothetical protein BDFB_004170 [Asbolus verrucosus]
MNINLLSLGASPVRLMNSQNQHLYYILLIKTNILNSAGLWSKYSMLKTTLPVKSNVDITHSKLKTFMKKQPVVYKPKKVQVFSRHEVTKFISEAPDEKFLMIKVAFLIGLSGACRGEELQKCQLKI